MEDRLNQIAERLRQVERELADPAVYSDQQRLKNLSREQKELTPVVETFTALQQTEQAIAEAREMLSDQELRELAQEELTRTKEQRERLRREFTANVSHELKTPLTSILGTAEILQNGLVKPEDVPHFAGNIHRETERLIGLVNDIIKLSRLDEGGGLGQWETVDLYEEARAVLEQLAPAAQRKQVTTRLQGGEALVRGVPQIVEEIVYNLCDNAIAYNRANGSVTVTVENTAFGPRITVADTGIGIPREAQGRVFERFYRVDKSHSSGGTGLGLSIVKHGAAYLGAQVELHSEPGHGSTFTLTFPKAGA